MKVKCHNKFIIFITVILITERHWSFGQDWLKTVGSWKCFGNFTIEKEQHIFPDQ